MMILSLQERPALVLIDIQKGFDDIEYWGGNRNNPEAEKTAESLLGFWRENQLPIFHIKHCSTNPESKLAEGNAGNEFKELIRPHDGEPVIKKNVNSAFIGTDFKNILDSENIGKLVIVGLTTDHCVSTTARMAGNFGYDTYIVSDATATFDRLGHDGRKYPAMMLHDTALASLHGEFATVVKSSDLMA